MVSRRPRGALAAPLLVPLLVLLAACGGEAALTGTDLGRQPAPDFALIDHRGETVRLGDARGKAVVLSFVYTNCPDVCPLTASKLRDAHDLLPEATRDRVVLLAVSVDPVRDTPEALRRFSERHGLDDVPSWHALGGDRAALEPIWRGYGIFPGDFFAVLPGAPTGAVATPAPSDLLAHTDATVVIDREGRQRVLLRSDFDPTTLARDLEALAG